MSTGHVTVDAIEERCILVGVISADITEEIALDYIDELEFLATTAGAITVIFFKNFLIRIQKPMLEQGS